MFETRSLRLSVCGIDWPLKPRCRSMLTRLLEDTAFGPDEIAIMVMAYEMGLTQINASGDNDPTAETLAQTIVMLAKQGERDPVRLEQRAISIMSDGPPSI
jgi:hypothetical protein